MSDVMTVEEYRAMIDARMPESAFQSQVETFARAHGWLTFHDRATNRARRCRQCGAVTPGARNEAGFPDLVMVRGSLLVMAELKTARGQLTADQQAWLERLQNADRKTTRLWRPGDWREIEGLLS